MAGLAVFVGMVVLFGVFLTFMRVGIFLADPVTEERAGSFSLRGGTWIDSLKLSWPYARFHLTESTLTVEPTRAAGRFHFTTVVIQRGQVSGISTHRTPLGSGWRLQGPGIPRMVLWPSRYKEFLSRWEALGWPTDSTHPRGEAIGSNQAMPRAVEYSLGMKNARALVVGWSVFVLAVAALGIALFGAPGLPGLLVALVMAQQLLRGLAWGCRVGPTSVDLVYAFRTVKLDRHNVQIQAPTAWLMRAFAVGRVTADGRSYRLCLLAAPPSADWHRLDNEESPTPRN